MTKKTLSSSLIPEKIIIGLSVIFFIVVFFNSNPWSREAFLLLVPIYAGIFYIIFYLPDHICYDIDNMYIKSKNGEIIVELKDIYMVKMTSIGIGHRFLWKIKYRVDNDEGDVRF